MTNQELIIAVKKELPECPMAYINTALKQVPKNCTVKELKNKIIELGYEPSSIESRINTICLSSDGDDYEKMFAKIK